MLKIGIQFDSPKSIAPSGPVRRGWGSWKAGFFDRQRVWTALGKAEHDGLMRIGALIRTIARRSMRSRKKASPPGSPPSSHPETGAMLRNRLFFAFDTGGRSVVIGPEALGYSNVPALHEYGGEKRNEQRINHQIGKPGPARLTSFKTKSKFCKQVSGTRGSSYVTYRKLTTSKMVANAEKFDEILYGPKHLKYPPRPYMKPALQAALPQIAAIWANSVK